MRADAKSGCGHSGRLINRINHRRKLADAEEHPPLVLTNTGVALYPDYKRSTYG
jgi:hypothetical protein